MRGGDCGERDGRGNCGERDEGRGLRGEGCGELANSEGPVGQANICPRRPRLIECTGT